MSKHTLFRDIFNLSREEQWDLRELVEMAQEAKEEFDRVGVPFTYEEFKAYMHRLYTPRMVQYTQNRATGSVDACTRQLAIIDGDNLDMIEQAAKEKGLI